MSDAELFLRLEFFALHILHKSEYEYGLMPFGKLLDMMELWKQMTGRSQPKPQDTYVEDLLFGL